MFRRLAIVVGIAALLISACASAPAPTWYVYPSAVPPCPLGYGYDAQRDACIPPPAIPPAGTTFEPCGFGQVPPSGYEQCIAPPPVLPPLVTWGWSAYQIILGAAIILVIGLLWGRYVIRWDRRAAGAWIGIVVLATILYLFAQGFVVVNL